ncbi:MAG: dihydropteroate synthase, partial [Pseudomonadota bacterium]
MLSLPRISGGPYVMGVLNLTPDSFSDGGKWVDAGEALAHALAMAQAGADIIDVGGESTRPGAGAVSGEEETNRTAPLIEAI